MELFNKSIDGMLLIEAGRFIDCNDAAVAMLGYRDRSELLQLHPSQISPPFQPDGEPSGTKADTMMAIAREQGNNRFEWLHLKADGSEIWIEVMLTSITLDGKEIIYTVLRDIHEKKQAELELRESRERHALALEATGFEIWVNNFVTGEISQPDRIYKKAGYEPGEVPTTFDALRNFIHPEDLEAAFEAISRHLEGETENYHAEFRFKTKAGAWMWLANYGKVYEKNDEGVPLKFIGLTMDITEKKETELALARLNSELEQRVTEEIDKRLEQEKLIAQQAKMALMGEMIGIIAHQWKQPLNGMAVLLEDICDAYEHKELDQNYLRGYKEKARQQIEFMTQTVDGFRTFLLPSRKQKEFGVGDAVRETVTLLAGLFQSREIEVDVMAEAVPTDRVSGYENEFKHVILNILSNARDAYLECETCRERKIRITIAQEGEEIVVTLQDWAGGIREDMLASLFDAYATSKGEKGTGIGLNISRTIIERMKGSLSASNENGGALFTIRLPLC